MNNVYSSVYRTDLASFIAKSFYTINPGAKYLDNWHIDAISEYLNAVTEGDIKRLIINIPPRYLKSIAVSTAWPAWLLGKDPTRRIMVASYSQILSTRHSLDCRLIMQSDWYRYIFPNAIISSDQNEKNKFSTTKCGFRFATSVGGTVTGEGGDVLILDDPHNPATIMSQPYRENVINWFDQVWLSRLNDKKNGAIIIVMQRLHEDDLISHIHSKKSANWELLSLPAIATKRMVISIGNYKKVRLENHILHRDREGKKELSVIREDLGEYAYAAQYQQKPLKIDNGLIKEEWLHRFRVYPSHYLRVLQSWDTASKTSKNSDYSVCCTIIEDKNTYYLIDVFRKKMNFPDLKKNVILLQQKYKPDVVLIEDKSSGQALIQELKSESNMPIIPITPKECKIIRLNKIIPYIESGKICFPYTSEWLRDFEEELLSFPDAVNDDQVDSFSQAINWLSSNQLQKFRIREI